MMKQIYRLTGVLILAASCASPASENQLPSPSGECRVGVTYFHFVDPSRPELFDNSQEGFREMTVKTWYPAEKAGHDPELYFEDPAFAVENFLFPEVYRTLKTNAYRDAPSCIKDVRYPVLVFSHGWGEHFSQNTILMEELASHGYIVFSLAHHFECKFSFYPDGSVIALDPSSARFNEIMMQQQNPEAMDLFQRMYDAGDDQERYRVFSETNQLMPLLMQESPQNWADDIDFLIGQLETINATDERLQDKLDLDRIGVFGMSMGGMATNNAAISNPTIKAGINIEGGLFGALLDTTLNIPYMFLNGKRYLGYGMLFVSKSSGDCYSFNLGNADHYNFTDYSVYPSPNTDFLLGEIDGKRALTVTNELVLAFFDKYLKGKDSIDLVGIASKYPEIETTSRLGNWSARSSVSLYIK